MTLTSTSTSQGILQVRERNAPDDVLPNGDLPLVEVATVDSFQGCQKDIIIVSMVRAGNENAIQQYLLGDNKERFSCEQKHSFYKYPRYKCNDCGSYDIKRAHSNHQCRQCQSVNIARINVSNNEPNYQCPECGSYQIRQLPSINVGFLSDPRRINVAFTRAKKLLVIIGHIPTMKNARDFHNLPIPYLNIHFPVAINTLLNPSPLPNPI